MCATARRPPRREGTATEHSRYSRIAGALGLLVGLRRASPCAPPGALAVTRRLGAAGTAAAMPETRRLRSGRHDRGRGRPRRAPLGRHGNSTCHGDLRLGSDDRALIRRFGATFAGGAAGRSTAGSEPVRRRRGDVTSGSGAALPGLAGRAEARMARTLEWLSTARGDGLPLPPLGLARTAVGISLLQIAERADGRGCAWRRDLLEGIHVEVGENRHGAWSAHRRARRPPPRAGPAARPPEAASPPGSPR